MRATRYRILSFAQSRVEIPGQHFEKHLTPTQQAALRACATERALKPGESMHKCGSCAYYEVRCDDPIIWYCKCCREGTCLVCNKALPALAEPVAPEEGACIICLDDSPPPIQSGCACRGDGGLAHIHCRAQVAMSQQKQRGNEVWWMCQTCKQPFTGAMRIGLAEAYHAQLAGREADRSERLTAEANPAPVRGDGAFPVIDRVASGSLELQGHLITCAQLRLPKAIFEEAIECGGKMCCPKCHLAGRKDDACTHMSCPRCSTPWCYVCGLSVADCDKSAPLPGDTVGSEIFLHNTDWETNEARCPMYLTQIIEVDPEWLGQDWRETATDQDFDDDNQCLEYFHRWQTIKRLQQARTNMGAENFELLFVHFASVRNCGFGLEEIMKTDTSKLIDRSNWMDEREEDYYSTDEDGQEEEEEEEVWEDYSHLV